MAAHCAINPQTTGQILRRCSSDPNNEALATKRARVLPAPKSLLRHRDAHCVSLAVIALTLFALMSGCAHIWTDAQGVQHITGLVHLQIPTADPQRVSANAIQMTSLGLTFVQSRWVNELVFGYSDSTLTQIGPDSCVRVSQLNEMVTVLNSDWEAKDYAH